MLDLTLPFSLIFILNEFLYTPLALLINFKQFLACLALGAIITITKLQNLGAGTQLPTIVVDGNAVKSVDNFVYLGSVFLLRRLLAPRH